MSYKQDNTNENKGSNSRINLDEVVEDEFNLSKKKQPIVDSKLEDRTASSKQNSRVNLNESE